MIQLRHLCYLWLFLLVGSLPATAQTSGPYYLSWQRQLVYGGSGAILSGAGVYFRSKTPDLLLSDLQLNDINSFDRVATGLSSDAARSWSNILLFGSAGLPVLFLGPRETRRDFHKVVIMFSETMLINHGLTDMVKSTFLRPRPYVFDENLPPETILSSNDRAAFLSGHTSTVAAATFFSARVFSDYYPDSRLRPYVWGVALTLPALTGYLRVRAGRHYPTDVIAGYVLGGAIGYLIPTLHKKPLSAQRLSIAPLGSGVYLSYRW